MSATGDLLRRDLERLLIEHADLERQLAEKEETIRALRKPEPREWWINRYSNGRVCVHDTAYAAEYHANNQELGVICVSTTRVKEVSDE